MGAWDWVSSDGNIANARPDLAPHKTENGANWYQDQWGGWREDTGTHYATNPALEATEGGGGEEGGFEFPTDLFPKAESQSGLPDYANEWVKNWLSQYSPQITAGLSSSLTGLENPIALNEAEKANLNYMANENLTPIVNNMGARGVLNSSVSRDVISKMLSDLGSTAYDKAQANQQNKINSYQKSMALLESILGASRQSTSTQSNEWAPYADMMSYILGSKE
jgi:polyhydroxyalkanoate synthesis regulator phasin